MWYEWHDKVAGFVSYGSAGGARAVEHLRGVMGELHVADVRPHLARKTLALFRAGERPQVLLINALDFENYATFVLKEVHEKALNALLDKLIAWGTAFKIMREAKAGS